MTRETKIGLLGGLAFIIVVGILLSEYISSTNEPQQAAVNTTSANVRDGVVTPGVADDGPPVTIAGVPVEAPRQNVPTNADLHPPTPPVSFVPGGAGRATQRRAPGYNGTLAAGIDGDPAPAGPGGAAALTQQHPNVLAYTPTAPSTGSTSSPQAGSTISPQAGSAQAPPAAPAAPPATYTAVAGDSVSRIAGRLMGGNNKTNRDLLVRANPALQNDGNVVVIGRTYVIPKLADPHLSSAQLPAQPAPHGPPAIDPAARPAEPARWYTVKGNDNLWRIAESQLGSGAAWTQIRDLNKDLLKDGETVHPNMRLRLPAKTAVAGAD